MSIIKAREIYSNVEQNAEIPADGSQDFAVDNSATSSKNKYGSMNTLLLVNRSSNAIRLTLDGTTFAELFANSTLAINAEDGLFFNLIRVTNLNSGAVCSANAITVRYGRNLITGAI